MHVAQGLLCVQLLPEWLQLKQRNFGLIAMAP
jgi:hypothetical protein